MCASKSARERLPLRILGSGAPTRLSQEVRVFGALGVLVLGLGLVLVLGLVLGLEYHPR